jgi:hypothetical protein
MIEPETKPEPLPQAHGSAWQKSDVALVKGLLWLILSVTWDSTVCAFIGFLYMFSMIFVDVPRMRPNAQAEARRDPA